MNWKVVCRDKNDGGLGVKDLRNLNLALLAKWWWRFFAPVPNLWSPFIRSLYYSRRRPLKEGVSFKPFSSLWRSVLDTRNLFKCGVTYSVGDGRLTSFWSDIWLGEYPLSTHFHQIYCAVRRQNSRVQDCYGPNDWKWRKICSGFTPRSQSEEILLGDFKTFLSGFHLHDVRDGVRWRWSKSKAFSVKSMYLFLQDSGVVDIRFDHLWKLKLPLKVKIFVRLVLRRRVLTADLLLKRGWTGDDRCVMCLGPMESADHIFVGYSFSNSLLATLFSNKVTVRASS